MAEIPYEYKTIDLLKGEQNSEEFKAMNAMCQVPVLKHGETLIQEGCAIMQYLMREFGGADSLYPASDPKTRARINRILYWYGPALQEPIDWIYSNLILTKILPNYPFAEWKAIRSAATLNDNPKRKGSLGLLNLWMSEREYLCSDQLTLADITVYWELKDLEQCHHSFDGFHTLQAWMAKVSQVPQIQEV
jgi:glutathione S-transferase